MSCSNFCEIRLLSFKDRRSAGSKGVEIKDTAGGAVETSDEEQAGAEVRMVDLHQLHLSTRLPLIHTRMTASDFHPCSLRSRPPPLRASAPPALPASSSTESPVCHQIPALVRHSYSTPHRCRHTLCAPPSTLLLPDPLSLFHVHHQLLLFILFINYHTCPVKSPEFISPQPAQTEMHHLISSKVIAHHDLNTLDYIPRCEHHVSSTKPNLQTFRSSRVKAFVSGGLSNRHKFVFLISQDGNNLKQT